MGEVPEHPLHASPKQEGARNPNEMRVRSRPLLETDLSYAAEVVPTSQLTNSGAGPSSMASAVSAGTHVRVCSAGTATEGGQTTPDGQNGGERLEQLRQALRTEETRKVLREGQLGTLGVPTLRQVPEQVSAPLSLILAMLVVSR